MADSLHQLLDKAIHKSKQRRTHRALLGKADGTLDSTRPNYVWARVTLPSGVTETEVLCTRHARALHDPVLVEENIYGTFEVIQTDPVIAEEYWGGAIGSADVGPHGFTHSRLGPDPIRVKHLQVDDLLVTPTYPTGTCVYLTPYLYQTSPTGAFRYYPGGTVDLGDYIPNSLNQQRPVIVGLDIDENTAVVLSGNTQVFSGIGVQQMPFSGADLTDITGQANFVGAAAVRLRYGHSNIQNYDIFQNVRQWHYPGLSGGSGDNGTVQLETRHVISEGTLDVDNPISITDIPNTYDHLELLVVGRGSLVNSTELIELLLNNDGTDSNYAYALHTFGAAASHDYGAGTGQFIANIPASTANVNYRGQIRLTIPRYAASDYKHITLENTWQTVSGINMRTGVTVYQGTAAIEDILLQEYVVSGSVADFEAGTWWRLTATKLTTVSTPA